MSYVYCSFQVVNGGHTHRSSRLNQTTQNLQNQLLSVQDVTETLSTITLILCAVCKNEVLIQCKSATGIQAWNFNSYVLKDNPDKLQHMANSRAASMEL